MKRLSILPWRKRRRVGHSVQSYQALVREKLRAMPGERSLALARAIGALTMEDFHAQGDGHVAVLKHHGLEDGMTVYDLGCGCGRTAQALVRAGWTGRYIGADVVPELLVELTDRCPSYETVLNYDPVIVAPDASLDLVFHWSVFTHLLPGESFLYMCDAFRALKPGGKLVFSFLELEDARHVDVFDASLIHLRKGHPAEQLDAFLHRDWIRLFAAKAGFAEPRFTAGNDGSLHPEFWQALVSMQKPLA